MRADDRHERSRAVQASLPVVVALDDATSVVWTDLHAMLEPYADDVVLVEYGAGADALPIDVVLAVPGESGELHQHIDRLLARHPGAQLCVVGPELDADDATTALNAGARGFLVAPDGAALVASLRAIQTGQLVTSVRRFAVASAAAGASTTGTGLTEREIEILTLIAQGLSNNEIADRSFISINTVKSYIRTAYRKIGVETRSKALLWCIDHGLAERPSRPCFPSPFDDEVTQC